MQTWSRRIRGAVGMGLTWAAAWAVAGILIGIASRVFPALPWHRFFEVFDAPLPALAIPGFVGGAIFSVVLAIAGRRRRFDELSLPAFVVWGAWGGLLLCLVPLTLFTIGLASSAGSTIALWRAIAVVAGPFTVLSALSAVGSLLLARRAERRRTLGATDRMTEAVLAEAEAQRLLARSAPVTPLHAAAGPDLRSRDARRR